MSFNKSSNKITSAHTINMETCQGQNNTVEAKDGNSLSRFKLCRSTHVVDLPNEIRNCQIYRDGVYQYAVPEAHHYITHLCRSWDLASLMYSFKYSQQDATSHNILYYCQCSTCFRRFLSPSSGAQKLYSIWCLPSLLAATASGNSKQAWHM